MITKTMSVLKEECKGYNGDLTVYCITYNGNSLNELSKEDLQFIYEKAGEFLKEGEKE